MRKLSAVCRSRETELQVTESDLKVSSGAVVTKTKPGVRKHPKHGSL